MSTRAQDSRLTAKPGRPPHSVAPSQRCEALSWGDEQCAGYASWALSEVPLCHHHLPTYLVETARLREVAWVQASTDIWIRIVDEIPLPPPPDPEPEPEPNGAPARLMTAEWLSDLLGVDTTTLENWRRNGFGPQYIKVGRQVRYRERDIEQWLDERTVLPNGMPQ